MLACPAFKEEKPTRPILGKDAFVDIRMGKKLFQEHRKHERNMPVVRACLRNFVRTLNNPLLRLGCFGIRRASCASLCEASSPASAGFE